MSILIESASLYLVAVIVLLVLGGLESNARLVIFNIVSQVFARLFYSAC
jgi:hypothetical protein